MRILGLDVGDATIGVAVSDPLGITAQGITTIRRKKKINEYDEVLKICNEYAVETILVGLPKNMNGSIGPQGEKVLKFCEELKQLTSVSILTWDERLTTVAAHRFMIEGDLRREKRKQIVDKIAAVLILQGYLDSLKNNYVRGEKSMDNFEDKIILTDEEGKEVEFDVVTKFDIEDSEYVIVVPADAEDVDAIALKIEKDEDGSDIFVTIDDDDEFNMVCEAYETLFYEDEDGLN